MRIGDAEMNAKEKRERISSGYEVNIIWGRRKHKPTVEELKRELSKKLDESDVRIIGMPIGIAESIMQWLNVYDWEVEMDDDGEVDLGPMFYSEDNLMWKKIKSNHRNVDIFMEKIRGHYGYYAYGKIYLK